MKLIAHILVLILLAPAVHAELATGSAAGTSGPAPLGGNGFSNELEKANRDAANANAGNDASGGALLKEHLSEQEKLDKIAAEKARIAARLTPADEALKRRLELEKLKSTATKETPDGWADSLLAPLKEAARPLKESWDQLRKKDGAPDPALAVPKAPEPILILVPEEQKKRSQFISSILWNQLVEDAKPWLIGVGLLFVLGVGAVQFLANGKNASSRASRSPVKSRRRGRS